MGRSKKKRAQDEDDGPVGPLTSVRVDKWLWAARQFKTRTLAAEACTAGHVEVNGTAAKSSKFIREGDEIDVRTPGGRRLLAVVGLADRRGPAVVAKELYEDKTPPEWREQRQDFYGGGAQQDKRARKRDRRGARRNKGW